MDEAMLKRMKLEAQAKDGASWFYWIAGISLINVISVAINPANGWASSLSTAGSLLFYGFFNGFFSALIGKTVGTIGGFIGALPILLLYGLFGYFASKKKAWAFIAGIIVYALDALLYLISGTIIAFGFHIIAIYFIFAGYKSMKELEAMPQSAPATAVAHAPAAPTAVVTPPMAADEEEVVKLN